MQKVLSQIVLFLVAVFFIACLEDYGEPNFDEHSEQIVIEGGISNKPPPHRIRVSKSTSVLDSILSYPVNNAIVRLSDNEQNVEVLKYAEKGYYESWNIQGKIGNEYTLEVEYDNELFSAKSKILPIAQIDSLQSIKQNTSPNDTGLYNILVFVPRTSQKEFSYYRIMVTVNDSLYSGVENLIAIDDYYVKSLNGVELPIEAQLNDTVKIELLSITRELYDYYSELLILAHYSLSSIYYFPQNLSANFTGGALGYFQTSAVSQDSIVIR